MQIKNVPVSELRNNTGQIEGLPENARIIKDARFKKLVRSIKDDPEMLEIREVVAYDTGSVLVVIMGNMRLRVCQELKISEVPTKILPTDTPVEKLRAYSVKDNVSSGNWDYDILSSGFDLPELELYGLDLGTFAPNVNPNQNASSVTDKQMDDAGNDINKRLLGLQSEFKDVICPKCGENFSVSF